MTDSSDLNALADELSFAATNTNGCLYSQRKMLNNAAKSLRAAASSQAGVLAMREAIDPWVDTRLVTFDATIVFGHGGLDFDRWEGLRSECHTRHGSFAIWKSGRHSWSIYGGKYGLLALDRYSSERQAKEEVSQLLLSYDNEAEAVAPALTASEGNAAPEAGVETATPASNEPVGWQVWHSDGWSNTHEDNIECYREKGIPVRPLYTRPEPDRSEVRERIAGLVGEEIIRQMGDGVAIRDDMESLVVKGDLDVFGIADAILSAGLVPDEAAIRADEREKCAHTFEVRRNLCATDAEIVAAIRNGGQK